MKLFLLSQDVNTGYDTHDSCIVAAKNEAEARLISPEGNRGWGVPYTSWAYRPEQVKVKCIGTATKGTPAGLILASFNAG